jgi:hypothetical protein
MQENKLNFSVMFAVIQLILVNVLPLWIIPARSSQACSFAMTLEPLKVNFISYSEVVTSGNNSAWTYVGLWLYAIKIPEKIKSVGFVSGAQLCHVHWMSAAMNNSFFAKNEWPEKPRNVLYNVWLQSSEPGPDPNIICAIRHRPVQTSITSLYVNFLPTACIYDILLHSS